MRHFDGRPDLFRHVRSADRQQPSGQFGEPFAAVLKAPLTQLDAGTIR